MNLIHKEHVTFLEVSEDGSEVSRALDGGTRGGVQLGTHLICHDTGKRGLSQSRRS